MNYLRPVRLPPCLPRAEDVGAFRVIYVAKFSEAIYVLHCFQKKSQKTAKLDRDLAAQRYRMLLKEPRP